MQSISTQTNDRPNAVLQSRWVLKLEDDGTVIYSRPLSTETGTNRAHGILGHNFFEEVVGFDDMTTYRQNFRSFVKSNKAAASFTWRHSSSGESSETTVLMTRTFQTESCPPTGLVMMEIRGC